MALPPVRFGTNGWRGVLGEDFHFAGARALASALTQWAAAARAQPRILIAHDHRFQGGSLAQQAARVVLGAGGVPILCRGATATPVVGRAVRGRAEAALIFTASHNAPEYQGAKVMDAQGAALGDAAAHELEALANAQLARAEPVLGEGRARRLDATSRYLAALRKLLDLEALGRARLRVYYDAMHGAGAGVLDAALEGAGVRVIRLRAGPDPSFGGVAPDPTPARLRELARRVRGARGLGIGFATDGDGDRFCLVDADGSFVSEADALALLVDELARSGRARRGLALSLAAGSLPERVARAHGLVVSRWPIGFKHLAPELVSGRADLAGDESGGFALAPFAHDKDGILACALLAQLAATTRAPLRDRLRALRRAHGRFHCGRAEAARTPAAALHIAALADAPPSRFDGALVQGARREGGLHLALADGFAMWRASGTEPVLRVYAEAPSRAALARRLAAALAVLADSGAPR